MYSSPRQTYEKGGVPLIAPFYHYRDTKVGEAEWDRYKAGLASLVTLLLRSCNTVVKFLQHSCNTVVALL
jgi:hypothetical protein